MTSKKAHLSGAENKLFLELKQKGLTKKEAWIYLNSIGVGEHEASNNGRIRGGVQAKALRRRIKKRDGFHCHYCLEWMQEPRPDAFGTLGPRMATIEHVVAKSRGGTRDLFNLVLACSDCNNERADQLIKCLCEFCCSARKKLLG